MVGDPQETPIACETAAPLNPGVGCTVQLVPFQCSARVSEALGRAEAAASWLMLPGVRYMADDDG
jgi:hypothetical protein